MTSEERREKRYQRRKKQRDEKMRKRCSGNDDFDQVFSYKHLCEAYKKCRKGVAWKSSVQKYITQAPLLLKQTYDRLQDGSFRSNGFFEFDINERGKIRHIKSVTINERVVQRCLCDHALVPVLGRTFIYDNGASTQDKGYSFAIRRLCKHLQHHYRKHGTDGYILLFDFSKFFDRVSHKLIKSILFKEFTDRKIIGLTFHFVKMFGDVGLGLGSQISQTFALASANRLDHYIKEVCGITGYGRYMDDGYLIHKSKKHLQDCLERIREICKMLDITLNEKKTKIVKLSHGFTYLKARFFISETGKVIRKINRKSITRERKKLKKLRRFLEEGKMSYADIEASWQSWKAYAETFSSYHTIQNMANLYNELFIQTWAAVQ